MKIYSTRRSCAAFILLAAMIGVLLTVNAAPAKSAEAPLWVTAYYAAWNQSGGMAPDQIDYSAITHLVHFSIVPRPDGTIDDTSHGSFNAITPAQSQDVVTRAHAAGVKVLVCLGGAGSGPLLSPVLADTRRGALIKNLLTFVAGRGYDGIDLDMEPIAPAAEANFIHFVKELHQQMKAAHPRWQLTFPASGEPGDQPKLCALLQDQFDQINIQTYDLSGAWDGFKTWHNGSLYGNGATLMTATRAYPSASEKVGLYTAAGVRKAKLGLGIAFYGYVWSGTDGPAQSIQGISGETLGYNAIMDRYFRPDVYHWDANAHAPYLSLRSAQPAARNFVSYDDARLAKEKVRYARAQGLGGVIIWELSQGYRANQPAGRRDVLLQAVKSAAQSR